MSVRELRKHITARLWSDARPRVSAAAPCLCRKVTTASSETDHVEELESASSLSGTSLSNDAIQNFDPVAQSKRNVLKNKRRLPSSRYQFRPPIYYRGPLHPHQPPPPSDPASREFIPGPFTLPRLEQTYQSTIEPDLMALQYNHFPPGYRAPPKAPRLRSWEGDSPYFKNRPLRGPRGGSSLRLLREPTTFRNVQKLEGVTLHTMVPLPKSGSAELHVSGMILQAISGARAKAHTAKKSVMAFGQKAGEYVSLTAHIEREDMYHFLGKLIDVVLPKRKEWRGVSGTSGDSAGNISFGFGPDDVILFPEVESNYDMYPSKMIPGMHVTIHTSAKSDREARMLLMAIGIPFYGKFVD